MGSFRNSQKNTRVSTHGPISKNYLPGELDFARGSGREYLAERRARERARRIQIVGAIEQIEKFSPQLKGHFLAQPKILVDVKINILVGGTSQVVSTLCAERVRYRGKRSFVNPA
jgi:hypothetical protein